MGFVGAKGFCTRAPRDGHDTVTIMHRCPECNPRAVAAPISRTWAAPPSMVVPALEDDD